MRFIVDIENVRSVQPAFSHNWDIGFIDRPILEPDEISINPLFEFLSNLSNPPLGDITSSNYSKSIGYFPATSCEFDLYNVSSKSFKVGNQNLKMPIDGSAKGVDIVFYDNESHTLEKWFDDWVNRVVLGKGKGTNVLERIVKNMLINELDIEKNIVNTKNYWVYPEGNMKIRFNSSGDIMLFNQSFVIVGDLNKL
jgi:hypothetical protein